MNLCGITVIFIMFWMILSTGRTDRKIYHHCYQEGGFCAVKNITCNNNNNVIVIMSSRVGYSEYWESNNNRTNCTVTDKKCEKDAEQLTKNCSGLRVCGISTCSEMMRTYLYCHITRIANYMRIKYKCIAREKFESTSSPPISPVNTSYTADTSKQSTSNNIYTPYTTDTSRQFTSDDGVESNMAAFTPAPKSQKATIVATLVVISAIVIIVTIIIIVIFIRRRKEAQKSSDDDDDDDDDTKRPKKISQLDKDEFGVNVIDNVNYVTNEEVTKVPSGIENRSIQDPYMEINVADDDNYETIGQGKDPDQIDLPTSKADLNTDTELVDNDDYVGFGEETAVSKVTSVPNYELAGPCSD